MPRDEQRLIPTRDTDPRLLADLLILLSHAVWPFSLVLEQEFNSLEASWISAERTLSFETMLGLASHHQPTSYWDIIGRDNPRKGVPTVRRGPRRRRTATGMRADGSRPREKLEPSPVSDLTRQP